MHVERITTISPILAIQILELLPAIKNQNIAWEKYIEYIIKFIDYDSFILVGLFDGDKLVGYTHMEQGHPITPDIAYSWVSAVKPGIPHSEVAEGLRIAEEWAKSKGCTKWRMHTKRSPAALRRAYGLEVYTDEYTLEKVICD